MGWPHPRPAVGSAGHLRVADGMAAIFQTSVGSCPIYRRVVVGLTDAGDGAEVTGAERGTVGRRDAVAAGGSVGRTFGFVVAFGGGIGDGLTVVGGVIVTCGTDGAVVVTRPTSAGPTIPGASTGTVSRVAPRVTPATAAATPPIPA